MAKTVLAQNSPWNRIAPSTTQEDTMIELTPSVGAPYKSGEFLRIDRLGQKPSLYVAMDSSEPLSDVLRHLPAAIASIPPCVSFEGRANLHERIVHLGTEVETYNKAIDANGWITFVHVLLLILTLGIFDYRSSCHLEKPRVPIVDLFPADRSHFATTTVGEFNSLPENAKQLIAGSLGCQASELAVVVQNRSSGMTLRNALEAARNEKMAPEELIKGYYEGNGDYALNIEVIQAVLAKLPASALPF